MQNLQEVENGSLIYKEKFKSKKEAISREYYIKNNRILRNKIKNENINSTSI